jgi:hypothetical protein
VLYFPFREPTPIGAFTSKNNTKYRILPAEPVKGDEIVVEYFEPKNVKQQGKLTIGSIGHDYKGIVNGFDVGGYGGTPLSCEVNAICAAPNWQNEKHAINRICYQSSVDGNFYLCTAALINNTAHDGTPYDLTANHCICNNSEATSVVALFNYESPTCTTAAGSLAQTISISTLVASSGTSDFALIQLSSIPPASFSPYYLGWDRTGNTPTGTVTCIHHPTGAVKKISTSTYGLSTILYDLGGCTSGNKDCWRLTNWTTGDVEHGSSGAPLLNNSARVIGQVYGDENGTIGCPGTSLNNLFGRFSRSWTGGGTHATQLSFWLDPCSSGSTTVDGGYPVTLTGANVVCSSGATFTLNYLPSGYTVNWSGLLSSNLYVMNATGNTATIAAQSGAYGAGYVQPIINSTTGCSYTLPILNVWVGKPVTPGTIGFRRAGTTCYYQAFISSVPGADSYDWSEDNVNWNLGYSTSYGLFNPNSTVTVYVRARNGCGISPTKSKTQTMGNTPPNCTWKPIQIITDSTQSVSAVSDNISIYPNPAESEVTLCVSGVSSSSDEDVNISSVAIVDSYGNTRKIKQYGTGLKSVTINISDLPNGFYYIRVNNNVTGKSYKLLIQK